MGPAIQSPGRLGDALRFSPELGPQERSRWSPSRRELEFRSPDADAYSGRRRRAAQSDRGPVDLESLELSPLQRGMLAVCLTSSHSGADILQVVIRSRHALPPGDVDAVWQQRVDEVEALRVELSWEGRRQPVQRVARAATVESARAAMPLQQFLQADRRRGFDLSRAPLMRVTHLDAGDGAYCCGPCITR